MEHTSLLTRLREGLNNLFSSPTVEGWLSHFGISTQDAINFALFFGIAFAVAFVLKKYLKFVFFCLVVGGILLYVLKTNSIIAIDWEALNGMLGFDPFHLDFKNLFETSIDWVKANVVSTISGVVGFAIGYKLG